MLYPTINKVLFTSSNFSIYFALGFFAMKKYSAICFFKKQAYSPHQMYFKQHYLVHTSLGKKTFEWSKISH